MGAGGGGGGGGDSTTNIIANCLAQTPPTEIIQCSMERYTLVFYKNYMPHFWSKPKGDEENCLNLNTILLPQI